MPEPLSLPVTVRERLWSDEVARANAVAGVPLNERELAYCFTNRNFYTPDLVLGDRSLREDDGFELREDGSYAIRN